MSADTGVTVTEAVLLPATGSVWSSAVLVAVLVTGVVEVAVAVIPSVALAPLASAPMFQMPVPALYAVPALGADDTYVRPAGSVSVTCTPVALTGPLLWAVMVNVTLLFKFGVALSTILVMAMSAACPVTVTDAVLFPATGSGC